MAKLDFSSSPCFCRLLVALVIPLSLFSLFSLFLIPDTSKTNLKTAEALSQNQYFSGREGGGEDWRNGATELTSPTPDPLEKYWCSENARESQSKKFTAARKTVGKHQLGCGQLKNLETFLATLWDPSREEVNLVNIGANKGYNLVEWLENFRLAPPTVSVSSWGSRLLRQFPSEERWRICGTCGDCKPEPQNLEEGVIYKGPGRGVHIYALEPSITNFKLLLDLKKWAGYGKITLLQAAASNQSGVLQFPVTQVGFTMGALSETHTATTVDVRVFTVEEFMEEHKIERINYLQIDTEGHDPLVMASAHKALEAHKIDLVEFEYHFFAHWKTTKLRSVVENFDSFGYDCFLELWRDPSTADHLVCLTGCWEETYEFHDWSNVLCSSRRNVKLTTFLRSMCKWL